jgi:hypothetical protein
MSDDGALLPDSRYIVEQLDPGAQGNRVTKFVTKG